MKSWTLPNWAILWFMWKDNQSKYLSGQGALHSGKPAVILKEKGMTRPGEWAGVAPTAGDHLSVPIDVPTPFSFCQQGLSTQFMYIPVKISLSVKYLAAKPWKWIREHWLFERGMTNVKKLPFLYLDLNEVFLKSVNIVILEVSAFCNHLQVCRLIGKQNI